ncbi:P-loop containing nucleoside triphosphate hydrolase protein [Catenaria anguillulae PL171]|uniref:Peroxisomal ATPase PEX1 n=1 Tax=Catenaria anguillulae PL171 TaxID=765915 RepID=A0A1Y2HXH0_9FUNG|nr:P-loop containing nucleoside triphosphate hydrolase protein [Catenaria anguillulae PL171]
MNRSLQLLYTKNKPAITQAILADPANNSAATTTTTTTTADPPATPKRKSSDVANPPANTKRRKTLSSSASSSSKDTDDAQLLQQSAIPTARLADLGGIDSSIEALLELVALPLLHPNLYQHTGVAPPRGILLHGPPGCGKTSLANALAGELQVPFFNISAPSIVSGMSGESEKKIRDLFTQAAAAAPCLVFIDEIDAITPKRESAAREMERRIVAQLLTCMDDVAFEKNDFKPVIIIGATNRADSIDPALRRAGRFDREISMNVPDQDARVRILQVLSAKLKLEGNFDFTAIAKLTPGFVGADLTALTAEAGLLAVKRIFETLKDDVVGMPPAKDLGNDDDDAMDVDALNLADLALTSSSASNVATSPAAFLSSLSKFTHTTIAQFLLRHPSPLTPTQLAPLAITHADFLAALPKVQPSSKREGFATVPDVTWDMIGALSTIRDHLRMAIVEPVARPELFARVGISAPAGVLLWGPPGCGKTLLAKAVANEAHSNFISVKGPELLNKYVGESERAVRQVFARARASSPCIIFFDEIDALVPRRDDAKSEATSRVVNTLLTELDGLEGRKQVFIIAATNRPDILDPAMLRPGRLDKLLYVELPTADERAEILRTVAKKTPVADDVDWAHVARDARCDGYSGADCAAVVREAGVVALREYLGELSARGEQGDGVGELLVCARHLDKALGQVKPSVSVQERKAYEALRIKLFGGSPSE